MKKEQEIEIVSVEYTNDEISKNKLIKLVIDCLLNKIPGGEVLINVPEGSID